MYSVRKIVTVSEHDKAAELPSGKVLFFSKESYTKRFQFSCQNSHLEFIVTRTGEDPYVKTKCSPLLGENLDHESSFTLLAHFHKIQRGLVQHTLFKMQVIQIAFCRESAVHSSFHKEVLHKSSFFSA